jgi:hypothetical protein
LFGAWLSLVEGKAHNLERARLVALEVPALDADSPLSIASHILLSRDDKRAANDLADSRVRGANMAAREASLDVRLAMRVLGQTVTASDAAEPGGLLIQADGAAFELDSERISIAKHGAMRRILVRLVEQHLTQRGTALPSEALARAGWPGERIMEDAAKNRVKVAIAGLRKIGLKDALIHDGSGYSLRRDLAVEVRASLPLLV